MVTVIKVVVPEEASSIGDVFDNGGKRHWNSDYVDAKNDNLTTTRYHGEPTNNKLCHSFERSNESITEGGATTSVTDNLYSSKGYVSYADIEAMCSDETSFTAARTPSNDYMPYSNIMAETATTTDIYREAAAAKRSRLENVASEFQHYAGTSTKKYKKRTQFAPPTGTSSNNKQSAPKKQKKARSAPKKQKGQLPTKNNVSTKPIDPTFKRHVKQVQQKQLSALLKTTSHNTTEGDKDGAAISYGKRGITQRQSGKWQVQYYYNGKSKYIGVFKSKTTAFAAYEMTREILGPNKKRDDEKLSDEEAQSKVDAARTAVFDALCSDNKFYNEHER